MEISKKQIELIALTPSENHYLTRRDRKDNEEVILSNGVILGKTDSPDNWTEIPIAEGDALVARLQAEQQIKMQKEINA